MEEAVSNWMTGRLTSRYCGANATPARTERASTLLFPFCTVCWAKLAGLWPLNPAN